MAVPPAERARCFWTLLECCPSWISVNSTMGARESIGLLDIGSTVVGPPPLRQRSLRESSLYDRQGRAEALAPRGLPCLLSGIARRCTLRHWGLRSAFEFGR